MLEEDARRFSRELGFLGNGILGVGAPGDAEHLVTCGEPFDTVPHGHHDAVLRCLRRGGQSLQLTAHAYALLDGYLYGFAFEEASLPSGGEGIQDLAADIAAVFDADEYPNLAEFTIEHVMKPGYSFSASFDFGLDLIIEGLAEAAKQGAPP